MSLTERQRLAATAPGGVAITAGAGTGKTHTLGHRYLEHLRDGLSPLQIVAVTFTERAAHELRARVRAYARRELDPADPRLPELEAAPIGTVHGLCLAICREHPDEAGVPHDASVLDPLEGTAWLAERLERVLAEVPSALFAVLPYERVRDALAALLGDPYRAERALAHGSEAWPAWVEEARGAARRERLDLPALVDAVAVLDALRGNEGSAGDKGEQARRAALAAVAAARAGEVAAALAHVKGYRVNAGGKKAWGDDQDALRGGIATVKRAIEGLAADPLATLELGPVDERLAALLPDLRSAFESVRDGLAAAKRRRRVLDFADLEVHALRALGHAAVLRHYRARWRALLVDEVQDTSEIQEAILDRLAGFCRTTVVGDEKQSIYGFRGADGDAFRRMAARIEGEGGARVELDVSFRTHAGLIDTANEAFAELLGAAHGPLVAHRREAPGPGPHLRRLALADAAKVPLGARRLAEAQRIAAEILTALDGGSPVHDADAAGGTRPLRPGDVAVLARAWAPLDLLAEILPAAGVPAVHTGGGDLLATREARDGDAVLRFLAGPNDDVALVAVLRGPCFAVADDVLEAFADAHLPRPPRGESRPSWWTVLQETRPEAFARPLAVLEALLVARNGDRPSRLLQRLDRATGWSAVVANLPGGPRRSADLEGFSALVRELERGNGDVFTVARRLRRLRLTGAAVDRPALEAEDAVTLTTIHRAKGLEWPLVVVAALDGRGGGRPPPVRMDTELGVALKLDDAHERGATPALWTLIEARAKAREADEDRRLLYVALTRARDHALVTAAEEKGSLLDLLVPGLDRAGVTATPFAYDPALAVWPAPPEPPRPEAHPSDLWRAVPPGSYDPTTGDPTTGDPTTNAPNAFEPNADHPTPAPPRSPEDWLTRGEDEAGMLPQPWDDERDDQRDDQRGDARWDDVVTHDATAWDDAERNDAKRDDAEPER